MDDCADEDRGSPAAGQWTPNGPQVPGYYWFRDGAAMDPEAVLVRAARCATTGGLEIEGAVADINGYSPTIHSSGQWYGPIEVPL